MSRINFSLQMNINETMQTIMAIGHELTPIVISEPGVGKSSILKMIEAKYGDQYDYIYEIGRAHV